MFVQRNYQRCTTRTSKLQVFPYEYQRALKQLEQAEYEKKQLEKSKAAKTEEEPEPDVLDIEDSISDPAKEAKVLVKLDKMR